MPVRRIFGQVLFLFLFLFCYRDSNSEFIRNSNHTYYDTKIDVFELQPRIRLFVNNSEEKEKKELRFVLDTGSNVSLIRKNIFINKGEKKAFKLKSISGEMDQEFIILKLNLFDDNLKLISENTAFHSFDFNPKFDFDGIIGNDILEKFDLFLELPENIYLIFPIPNKINLTGFRKIPFVYSEGHIIINIKIGNQLCKFLLDSGAGISYLNQVKANELNLKIGGKASYMDISGELIESIYHIGENLCVDENMCQKKIELISGNSIENFITMNGRLDGILGLNWIEKYSILIDFQNFSLYIKQR